MKRIEYRITFGNGFQEVVAVYARNITAGFTKALILARRDGRRDGDMGGLHSIEFWQVTS